MVFGYNRVSTRDQNLDRGNNSIVEFCKEQGWTLQRIYQDKQSGKTYERYAYQFLKNDVVRKDDIIIVPEYDRLGRAEETKQELEYFKSKGVRVIFLDIPTTCIDLSSLPEGVFKLFYECINDMLIQLFDIMSRAELEKNRKRQREGIEAKKKRDDWEDYGRPRRMKMDDFLQYYKRVVDGKQSGSSLRRELNMPETTYYRYVKIAKKILNDETKKER